MLEDRKNFFWVKTKITLTSSGVILAFVAWVVAAFVFFAKRDYGAEELSFDRASFKKEADEAESGESRSRSSGGVLPPCLIEANPETNPVYPPFSDDDDTPVA